MAIRKVKTVFTAEASQLAAIQALVRAGRYRTTSEFLREAIDDKLARIRAGRVAEQVARYCAAGHADEDLDLIDAQSMVDED